MNKIIIAIITLIVLGVGGYYLYNFDDGDIVDYPYVTGYVYETSSKEVLVSESMESLSGDAIWLNVEKNTEIVKDGEEVVFEELQVGVKVSVFVEGSVMESYPAQGVASRIIILENVTVDKNCYIGGCSGEICTDNPEAVSSCELLLGMECLGEGMSCELVDNTCTWVLSEKAARCFLDIEEEYGESLRETRIGNLFYKAELKLQ